ncbi:GIY-YIG nuclease family protein [Roseateles albus]|uniref:GIY-YIG nuclease family protein n=1 Tax=Roseateles albus TaxID=2987525 RepID=A0ABT5KCW0_9BURK|nr:GIY-YIG nuclease family protein [Roseateles albus]MDC8771759.1 GIY-YIG nuclease family protein [Roseateles albus]
MSQRPQTIQIYLPGGDPRGVRVAELTTRIVQVLEVPRSLLGEFLKMPESKQVAVYFLVGQGNDAEDPKVYVGQTSDLPMRFRSHNQEKDFWERALVVISRTQSFTQTHTLFLEWWSLQEAKKAGRYITTNGNNASRPFTPAPLEADCYEIYDTAKTLLATLGFPLFEPVKPIEPASEGLEMLFLKGSGCDGRGYYTEEGFVLLADSTGRRESVQSIKGTADERFRERFIEAGHFVVDGDKVTLTKDHIFRSPSRAAVALLGRTANGWNEWKNAAGKTLHELKRVTAEPDELS